MLMCVWGGKKNADIGIVLGPPVLWNGLIYSLLVARSQALLFVRDKRVYTIRTSPLSLSGENNEEDAFLNNLSIMTGEQASPVEGDKSLPTQGAVLKRAWARRYGFVRGKGFIIPTSLLPQPSILPRRGRRCDWHVVNALCPIAPTPSPFHNAHIYECERKCSQWFHSVLLNISTEYGFHKVEYYSQRCKTFLEKCLHLTCTCTFKRNMPTTSPWQHLVVSQ